MTFRRIIHQAKAGGYRQIPLTISISRSGSGDRLTETLVTINGRRADKAEVHDLSGFDRLDICIERVYGR